MRFSQLLFVLFISASALSAFASSNSRILGTYKCMATQPHSKHPYHSKLMISSYKRSDNLYRLHWSFKDGSHSVATAFISKLGSQRALMGVFDARRQAPHVKSPEHYGSINYAVRQRNHAVQLRGYWYYFNTGLFGKEQCRKVSNSH